MSAAGTDARAAELVLASLYLEPTPEREAALRRAAEAGPDWERARESLEAHGVLGLALRNLEEARAVLPATVRAQLARRAEAMHALALGFRLTLTRFLAECRHAGIEVTLLKGASLEQDLYPTAGLRAQGDLDLLVRVEDVHGATAAAQRIGLVRPRGALPVWWYRLAHFHLKLVPVDALQRELELHWHLHPPAQLLTVSLEALRARRRAVTVDGEAAWTLERADRFLHLLTHLARHAPGVATDRATLLAIAGQPAHAVRLKWILDLGAELERRHAELAVETLVARAAEWNAVEDLARGLAWVRVGLGLVPAADAWAGRVLARLAAANPARAERAARPESPSQRPLPGLDLRASALSAFPRWVWPPASVLERLHGRSSGWIRLEHAARVLAHATLVGLATPIAWLMRRERTLPRADAPLAPEQALELAAAAHRLARAEDRAG